jgi:hypothetical protein
VDPRIPRNDGATTQSVSDPAGLRPGEPRADQAEARDRAARFKETLTQERPGAGAEREAAARRAEEHARGQGSQGNKASDAAAADKGRKPDDGHGAKGTAGRGREGAGQAGQAGHDGQAGDARLGKAGGELGEAGAVGGLGRRGLRGKSDEGGEPGGEGAGGGLGAEALSASEGLASRRASDGDKGEAALIAEQLAAVNVQWVRPEGPTRVEAARRRELAGPVDGANPMHRLLIGQGPGGAEARLSITVGPLAGAEIHLTHGPDGVHAVVLTQGASSRQTLASAMDEVAKRLKEKGHKIDIKLSQGPNAGAAQGEPEPPSLLDELTDRPRRG